MGTHVNVFIGKYLPDYHDLQTKFYSLKYILYILGLSYKGPNFRIVLTSIQPWNNHIVEWYQVTYPFLSFNDTAVQKSAKIDMFIPDVAGYVITYPWA